MCRSGSAADTQAITAYVQYYLHQHQMELNDEILVKTAASFATKLVYSNKASAPSHVLLLFCPTVPQPSVELCDHREAQGCTADLARFVLEC